MEQSHDTTDGAEPGRPGGVSAPVEPADRGVTWAPWAAIAGYSGFEVANSRGRVSIAQIGVDAFAVATPFRFIDQPTLDHYRHRLVGAGSSPEQAEIMLDDARALTPDESITDLASIPRFVAWFEDPYGRHTLAAILHDKLIVDEPNGGDLGNDILSDSLFRDMMGVAGVPLFKRWLMWAAVAARTRWVAGGYRRLSLILWGLLGVIGVASGVVAALAFFGDLGSWDRPLEWALVAVTLPIGAALLWGRQYGAGIVAAAAGLWLIPAAVIVVLGLGVYMLSEKAIARFHRRPPPSAQTLNSP
ncbi:MAG: DUF1353 domain-containing protein [Acidimicrobiales bacterium]